jgi:hypothetical protein
MEKALGNFIFNETRKVGEEIEKDLIEISVNGEEWAVEAEYSFSFSPDKKIRDYFLVKLSPYINDKRQGTYKFKFNSLDAIFLSEVCEVMYKIILKPEDAEKILFNAKVTVEQIQD